MLRKIIISLFGIWTLSSAFGYAQISHEWSHCFYDYYAVTGKGIISPTDMDIEHLQQLDGVKMPLYVGYVKMESEGESQRVLSLEYSKETDLYVYAVDDFLTQIVETKSINKDSQIIGMDDTDFYYYFVRELPNKGLERIEHETHLFRKCPDGPSLTAVDFEFEETCIFRPFADPPELCLDLEIKLKNDPKVENADATQ